jgi:hypothetical protein
MSTFQERLLERAARWKRVRETRRAIRQLDNRSREDVGLPPIHQTHSRSSSLLFPYLNQ